MKANDRPDRTYLEYRPFKSPEDAAFFHKIQRNENCSPNTAWGHSEDLSWHRIDKMQEKLIQDAAKFDTVWLCESYGNWDRWVRVAIVAVTNSRGNGTRNKVVELNIGMDMNYELENARKIVNWVVNWAFDKMKVERVEFNVPSFKTNLVVGKKFLGFLVEGTRVGALSKKGDWRRYDEHTLGISRDEWISRQIWVTSD
ncbi:hypothetical protein N7466_001775 [Penicillium verhagenii]|uniref:uncharacterized protein n=1 Tax=Penicillium verhagenii TaxID=1562060 RepID=UPI002544E709|nr:uncharacterized protein N7466_001775 [Penicillium verhagenii]KAJ5938641.1 hypothetical protein N7466_001775 [Penicillium verhagenii]